MGDDNNAERETERTFLEKLEVVGQLGELSAFMRNVRLAARRPIERASLVKDQYERERAQVLQWLKKTGDPNWWDGASEQDVFEVFGVSSTWKDDSDAVSAVDKRIRQEIQSRYGIDVLALDTTPPWDEEN